MSGPLVKSFFSGMVQAQRTNVQFADGGPSHCQQGLSAGLQPKSSQWPSIPVPFSASGYQVTCLEDQSYFWQVFNLYGLQL